LVWNKFKFFIFQLYFLKKEIIKLPGTVAHTCDPNYLGQGRAGGAEIRRIVVQDQPSTLISKIIRGKWTWRSGSNCREPAWQA
jgi:hypothetical protein